jgi:hypothetical protein
MNAYLKTEMGWDVPTAAVTAHMVHGAFCARVDEAVVPSGAERTVPTMDASVDLGSTASSVGLAATNAQELLVAFIASVLAVAELPLTSKDRASRMRFLSRHGAAGLPPTATAIVVGLQELDSVLAPLLADESVLPQRQPHRDSRLECQQFVQSCNAKIQTAKGVLEDALNGIVDNAQELESDNDVLYHHCDQLYSGVVEPRLQAAEVVLAAKVALSLRAIEVVDFAAARYHDLRDGPTWARIRDEFPDATASLLAAVPLLREAFTVAARLKVGEVSARDAKRQLEALTDDLLSAGVQDADRWVADYLWPRYAPPEPAATGSAKRTLQRTYSSGAFGKSAIGGTSLLQSMVERPAAGGGATEPNDVARWLDCAETEDDVNVLCDALGRVNMWLRRSGLAHEVNVDEVRGKVQPATGDSGNIYLAHTLGDGLWTRGMSEQYEHACVRYQQLVARRDVTAELEELLTLPDDQFVRACHDDMLASLFNRADDACVSGEGRRKVERRLAAALRMRIKVFHHSGDIRAVTLPQTASLHDVFRELAPWMPDLPQCRLSYLDDSDRISLATSKELEELVRQARASSIAAGGLGALGASLSRSVVTASGVGDVKLDLYVDPPRIASAAPSSKKAVRDLVQKTAPHTTAPTLQSSLTAGGSAADEGKGRLSDTSMMRHNLRMLQRRAELLDEGVPVQQPSMVQAPSAPLDSQYNRFARGHPSTQPVQQQQLLPAGSQVFGEHVNRLSQPQAEMDFAQASHHRYAVPVMLRDEPVRSTLDALQWNPPTGLRGLAFAQHTVVGDEHDEARIDGRDDTASGPGSPARPPPTASRAAALRSNRRQ